MVDFRNNDKKPYSIIAANFFIICITTNFQGIICAFHLIMANFFSQNIYKSLKNIHKNSDI